MAQVLYFYKGSGRLALVKVQARGVPMADPTARQAHLIAAWADRAAAMLDKALNVAEHTEDTRLIAKVRHLRDRTLDLHNDYRGEWPR